MYQKEMIQQVVTKEDIKNALAKAGVMPNMLLEVHANLSSMGHVIGGARTVVDALLETVGEGGTILMPMHFSDNSEPSSWNNPSVSSDLWESIREEMPASDPELSDLGENSEIIETFRKVEGVVYSGHPSYAFAALGKYSKVLCNRQSTHFPMADESPIARLYELKGNVLLLGCDFKDCTCMHLAEYHSEARPIVIKGASALNRDGDIQWKQYLDLDLDDTVFEKVGEIMRKKGMIQEASLNTCHIQLFSAINAVDETSKYFDKTIVFDLYR